MTATVNNPTPVVQTFSECSVLATGCGSVTYSLDQVKTFVTLDATTKTISVLSTNTADVATYDMGLVATLASYSNI